MALLPLVTGSKLATAASRQIPLALAVSARFVHVTSELSIVNSQYYDVQLIGSGAFVWSKTDTVTKQIPETEIGPVIIVLT